MLGSLIIDLGI